MDHEMNYETLMEVVSSANITVYDELDATNATAAMEEFFAHPELRQPNFQYGNLDCSKIAYNLERLRWVRQQLRSTDLHLDWRQSQILCLALEDAENRNCLINALIDGHDEDYMKLNCSLYGEPTRETFTGLMHEKIMNVKSKATWFVGDDYTACTKLFQQFPNTLWGDSTGQNFRPEDGTVRAFAEVLHGFYANLLRHVPRREGVFQPAEVVTILNNILQKELDTTWQAELSPAGVALLVNENSQTIKIPGQRIRSNYTYNDMVALIISHELDTYTTQKIMGQITPNPSTFKEGLVVCAEQALRGEYSETGVDYYLAIGMANFYQYDFRQVYETLLTLNMLSGIEPFETSEDRAARYQQARKNAFRCARRCFRGLGRLPLNKDLVYFSGSNMVWKFVKQNVS